MIFFRAFMVIMFSMIRIVDVQVGNVNIDDVFWRRNSHFSINMYGASEVYLVGKVFVTENIPGVTVGVDQF